MIELKNLRELDKDKYDEIWFITADKRVLNYDNAQKVKEMAPSNELFYKFYNIRKSFNKRDFESWYLDRFISEKANSVEFRGKLREAVDKSKTKDIALVCYCQEESLCHRSIVGGILKGLGANINCSDDYLKYYYKFLDNSNMIRLSFDRNLDYTNHKLSENVNHLGVILDSDKIEPQIKEDLDKAISNNKLIAITNDSGGILLQDYLKEKGYDNFVVFDDLKGSAKKDLLSACDETSIFIKKVTDKFLSDIKESADNSNKYIKLSIEGMNKNISINKPQYLKGSDYLTESSIKAKNEPKKETINKNSIDYMSEADQKRVKSIVTYERDLITEENVDAVRHLLSRIPRDIMKSSPEKFEDGVDEDYKKFYTVLYNELHKVNDANAGDASEVNKFYSLVKAGIYDKIFDVKGYDTYKFNKLLTDDLNENGLIALNNELTNFKDGLYKIVLPYDEYDTFARINESDGYKKAHVEVNADIESEGNRTRITFSSFKLALQNQNGELKRVSSPGNTIYIPETGYTSDMYALSEVGKPVSINYYSDNYKPLNALIYINSSNPDVMKTEDGAFLVGENKSKETDKVDQKGHWKAVNTREGRQLHFVESRGPEVNGQPVIETSSEEDFAEIGQENPLEP